MLSGEKCTQLEIVFENVLTSVLPSRLATWHFEEERTRDSKIPDNGCPSILAISAAQFKVAHLRVFFLDPFSKEKKAQGVLTRISQTDGDRHVRTMFHLGAFSNQLAAISQTDPDASPRAPSHCLADSTPPSSFLLKKSA